MSSKKQIGGFRGFIQSRKHYGLYSTLHFLSGCVANRRNSLAITSHRALPDRKCNALYRSFNHGFQV